MEELDLKDLFEFYKTKLSWIIIAILACVAIGNLYIIFTRTPMYKSETKVLIVNGNGINTNVLPELAKSRNVLDKVISNLDLDYNYKTLKSHVTATMVEDTKIITIGVSDKDPKQAVKIAKEIEEEYETEVKRIYNSGTMHLVEEATESSRPYNTSFKKDNIIFVAIGAALSCGLIFLLYYFDTSVKSVDEIEDKFGLTIIGTVPKVSKEK